MTKIKCLELLSTSLPHSISVNPFLMKITPLPLKCSKIVKHLLFMHACTLFSLRNLIYFLVVVTHS